jgi:putative Ca2+/H+ antiporter (TMEM165/GDT1 family)
VKNQTNAVCFFSLLVVPPSVCSRSLDTEILPYVYKNNYNVQIFKLFLKAFTMTFIAEWGDRSQAGPPHFVLIKSAISYFTGVSNIIEN